MSEFAETTVVCQDHNNQDVIYHFCPDQITDRHGYGQAIDSIAKVDSIWIAGNDEYGTTILYCPWCGKKLP